MLSEVWFGKKYMGSSQTIAEFEAAITTSFAYKHFKEAKVECNVLDLLIKRGIRRDKLRGYKENRTAAIRKLMKARSELRGCISELSRVFRVRPVTAPAGKFILWVDKLFYK